MHILPSTWLCLKYAGITSCCWISNNLQQQSLVHHVDFLKANLTKLLSRSKDDQSCYIFIITYIFICVTKNKNNVFLFFLQLFQTTYNIVNLMSCIVIPTTKTYSSFYPELTDSKSRTMRSHPANNTFFS